MPASWHHVVHRMLDMPTQAVSASAATGVNVLQAQKASRVAGTTHSSQKMPSFGKSITRSLSRGSGSSSEKTLERAAAAATAMGSQPSSSGQGGMMGMALGFWRKATSKLFDLEAKIANQVRLDSHACCGNLNNPAKQRRLMQCVKHLQ